MPSERPRVHPTIRLPSRASQRTAALVASVLATAASTGCWSGHTGDRQRLTSSRMRLPPEVWPLRDTACLLELLEKTPETIGMYRLAEGADESVLSEEDRKELSRPAATVIDKGVFGYGLVRVYSAGDPMTTQAETAIQGFTPNTRVLTSRGWNDPDAVRIREEAEWVRGVYNDSVGKETGVLLTGDAETTGLWAGVPVRIPPAVPGVTPTGVVLHYHSIAANPHEVAVLAEFSRRGWLVVDMATFAVVRAPHRVGTE